MNTPAELRQIYLTRFAKNRAYRAEVWETLISHFFSPYLRGKDAVLDLGCGYGEFINQVRCREKFAMDLNPDTSRFLSPEVKLLAQDCSAPWPLPVGCLDLVFSSNFFEHLPDKATLSRTLAQAARALRPGGTLIALGPNIRCLDGAYWDFWDHYLPLSHFSLLEGLRLHGFEPVKVLERFLPYTMVDTPRYPLFFLKLYLSLPFAFRLFGKQFLVVVQKNRGGEISK